MQECILKRWPKHCRATPFDARICVYGFNFILLTGTSLRAITLMTAEGFHREKSEKGVELLRCTFRADSSTTPCWVSKKRSLIYLRGIAVTARAQGRPHH
jgi:hypothetical protein